MDITISKKRVRDKNRFKMVYYVNTDTVDIENWHIEKGIEFILTHEFLHAILNKTVSNEASYGFDRLTKHLQFFKQYCRWSDICRRIWTCEFCPYMIGMYNRIQFSNKEFFFWIKKIVKVHRIVQA